MSDEWLKLYEEKDTIVMARFAVLPKASRMGKEGDVNVVYLRISDNSGMQQMLFEESVMDRLTRYWFKKRGLKLDVE